MLTSVSARICLTLALPIRKKWLKLGAAIEEEDKEEKGPSASSSAEGSNTKRSEYLYLDMPRLFPKKIFTPGGPHHPAGGPAVRVRGRGGAVAGLVRHDAPGAPRHHRRGSY